MTRKIPSQLTLILAIFTCTYFLYRDFGVRMIFGYALLGAVLLLHLLDRLRRNEPLAATPITAASALLVLVILLQYLRFDARRDEDTIPYFISMVICMAYVLLSAGEPQDLRRACTAMYAGAMAMAVFVVVFTFLPELFLGTVYPLLTDSTQSYYDYFASLGYGVSLGGYSYTDYILYLGMAVCFACTVVKPRSARSIAAGTLSLAFLLLAMVILGRRGELLAALVSMGLLILALCSRRKRGLILLFGILCTAGGIALVLIFLPYLRQIPFLLRYVETVEQILSGTDFTSGRGPLMAAAVRGFLAHPIFGMGWGQYLQMSAQVGMCDTNGKLIDDCHNIYLQFLCETGITGTIALLIPIFYLLYLTCRVMKEAKTMTDKTPLQLSCFSFLLQVFLLVVGIYDPTFQKLVFWCLYALALISVNTALILSGWQPMDPVSRLLVRLTSRLAPLWDRCWNALRTPWKNSGP